MVQKGHLLFKIISIVLITLCSACFNRSVKEEVAIPASFVVAKTENILDTITLENKELRLDNGVYYLHNVAYTGYIKEMHDANQIKNLFLFRKGKQDGISKSYYNSGQLMDSRNYKNGKAYGRHYGFWENGNQKYDFIYFNDKREGLQKQWYESGSRYAYLNFKNDAEDGMQKAWRQNGKPYINYQAKEGHRYGLQKSNLCYTLLDGKLKLPTNENK